MSDTPEPRTWVIPTGGELVPGIAVHTEVVEKAAYDAAVERAERAEKALEVCRITANERLDVVEGDLAMCRAERDAAVELLEKP